MTGTILVPLDGSALAEAALPPARRLARLTGARVVLVRVAEAGMTLRNPLAAQDRAVRAARAYLRHVARDLGTMSTRGPAVSIDVRVGDPAAGIATAAQTHGADVIAMSTHGRSGLGRMVLGSVADRVLHATTVPLLLVRAPSGSRLTDLARVGPYHRILVPLDGSALAEQTLRYVGQQEWTRGATLLLVQSEQAALTPLAPPVPLVTAVPSPVGPLLERDTIAAEPETGRRSAGTPHSLLEAAHRYAPGRATQVCAAISDPGPAIIHIAMDQEVDMIAMATHARSGLERVRSGSVAAYVVAHTPVPVLLLHAPATAVGIGDAASRDRAAAAHP